MSKVPDAPQDEGKTEDAEVTQQDAVIVFVHRAGEEISVDVGAQGDVRATEIATLLGMAGNVWAQKIGS